jgi:UrcA family protein
MNTRIENALHATFASVALGIGLLISTHAFAASPDGVRVETVKFADLNIGTPSGVAALFQRIHAAAERVCEPSAGENRFHTLNTRACVQEAQSRAVAQVNLPQLTAYSETKQPPPRS